MCTLHVSILVGIDVPAGYFCTVVTFYFKVALPGRFSLFLWKFVKFYISLPSRWSMIKLRRNMVEGGKRISTFSVYLFYINKIPFNYCLDWQQDLKCLLIIFLRTRPVFLTLTFTVPRHWTLKTITKPIIYIFNGSKMKNLRSAIPQSKNL